MSRIKQKILYKISFTLKTSLAIGSGKNNNTDKDIILDGRGVPYIPGSAIAGVCCSLLGKDDNKDIWGWIEKSTQSNSKSASQESKLIFYDAVVKEGFEPKQISIRDSVALDDYKVAKDGAKFDMEVLEPGASFETIIEQSLSEGDECIAEKIAGLFANEEVVFGGKTMRGYGEITNVKVYEAKFNLTDSESLEKWLSFDKYDENDACYREVSSFECSERKMITLALEQNGGISIRKYTTDVKTGASLPDFEQLTLADKERPVIPGTSWAGAFEHHMREVLGVKQIDTAKDEAWKECFGYISNEHKSKSKIRFSESIIDKAFEKVISRNSIDRFSGGTVDGALYTEKTFYNGETELRISFEKGYIPEEKIKKALAVSIADLNEGFMAVGGETSIGRGLFKVKSINGESFTDSSDLYDKVLNVMQ